MCNKKSLIVVDSRDRITPSDDTSSFRVRLQKPLTGVTSIALVESSIPATVYNIRPNINNKFRINDGSVKTVTLTPKSYTPSTLATALQSGLNASGSALTFTVTYDSSTFKLTVSATGDFTILFSYSDSPWRECGFPNSDTSSSSSHTSPSSVNLSYPHYYHVRIRELSHDWIQTTHSLQVGDTFIIPVNTNSGYVDIQTLCQYFPLSRPIDLSMLSIDLFLRNGEVCNLNNSDFCLTFQVEHQA